MYCLHRRSSVLLTGATGLIGGELLRAMLDADYPAVTALVRAGDQADPGSRVAERLRRSGRDLGRHEESLQAVAGDLRLPGLGLASADSERLRADVEIVIHSAAETSFLRSRNCHETNVIGTRNVIDFARTCVRSPLLVYISTATNGGVLSHCVLREEDGCRPDGPHHNDYTYSKAVAEQMVRDSGLPYLVLRPSIVFSAGLPDPAFARAILWFVPLLNEFDAVPVTRHSRLDVVPVSFVVESTLALLQSTQRNHDCYHISAGPAYASTCADIAEFLDEFYSRENPIRMIPPDQWNRVMHRTYVKTPDQRKIFAMLRHYLPFLNMDVAYDNTRLMGDLGPMAPVVAPLPSYLGDLLAMIPLQAVLAEGSGSS